MKRGQCWGASGRKSETGRNLCFLHFTLSLFEMVKITSRSHHYCFSSLQRPQCPYSRVQGPLQTWPAGSHGSCHPTCLLLLPPGLWHPPCLPDPPPGLKTRGQSRVLAGHLPQQSRASVAGKIEPAWPGSFLASVK